ncbi:MAG TPA: M23 family metallopeptidase [Kribbella sp.]
MRRSLLAACLACAVVLAVGGFVLLRSNGGFDRSASGKSADPLIRSSLTTPGVVPSTPSPTKAARSTAPPTRVSTPVSPGARLPEAKVHFVFPVGGCKASASQSHHDYPASDIFAAVGCRFVAPVDGRVDEVTRVDSWNPRTNVGRDRGGLSVSVVGVDGVRYYGSHLSQVGTGIKPGLQVRAGQTLGLIGKTGSARFTPSHLHFGISWPTAADRWWIRRGAVAPQPFLTAWRQGKPTSPARAVARARTSYGVDHGCRAYC